MTRFERTVQRYTRIALAKPWLLLALFAIPTVLSVLFGRNIDIRTDLASLLPDDAPSVVAIEESRSRRGSTDFYVIAVQSPDPLANVQMVDALAERIVEWPEVTQVDYQQDRSFFRDNALLFLPVEDLEQIRDNVGRMIRRELGNSNPLFVDLEAGGDDEEEEEDESWRDPDNWVHPTTLTELGMREDEFASMFPFMAAVDGDAPEEEEAAEPEDPSTEARESLPEQYQDYRISPNGEVAVVMARVTGRSTDIDFARELYERGTALVAEIGPENFHPELIAEPVGAYRAHLEVKSIVRDVSVATGISIGLVFFLLIGYFRRGRAVVIVLSPLLVGVAWTLGLVFVIYGHLNTLTAFIFAMLIGMGIDFGIHLYGRAIEEFNAGKTWEDALTISITRTGRALLTATVTTIVSLLTLTLASFDGFVEFGITCGMGVGVCLLATMLLVPVLVGATEKVWPDKRKEAAADGATGPQRSFTILRFAGLFVLGLAVFGVISASGIEFETNFRNLRGGGTGQKIAYGSAVGPARSTTPAVLLGQSEAEMREVHQVLRQRLRDGDERIRQFVTIETFEPSDQEARMEVIDEIYEDLDRRAVRNIEGEMGDAIAALRDLTDVEPFTRDDLPEWTLESLRERDGSVGAMGLLYTSVRQYDANDVAAFQERYTSIPIEDGEVAVGSSVFVISDVLRYVQADGARLGLYVAIGLFLILLIDLRSIVGVVACMLTLGAAVLMTAACMVVYDIKLGLYNIVVLPTVLGVGIDGAIHIYHRYLEEGKDRMWMVLKTTGAAVTASSITTAAGFVGLLLIEHKGVITIGQLAVTGILCSLVAVIGLLPAALTVMGKSDPHNPFEAKGPASEAPASESA